jgi:hypothetical protein
MKVSRIAAAIALMGIAAPIAAQAGEAMKPVGHVSAASGSVFISRDGKLVPATTGQSLFKGDRIVTRADAKAQVALNGCDSQALAPASILAVTSTCDAAKTLTPSKAGYANGNAALSTGGVVVGLLALAAITTGVIVATDEKDTPTSP